MEKLNKLQMFLSIKQTKLIDKDTLQLIKAFNIQDENLKDLKEEYFSLKNSDVEFELYYKGLTLSGWTYNYELDEVVRYEPFDDNLMMGRNIIIYKGELNEKDKKTIASIRKYNKTLEDLSKTLDEKQYTRDMLRLKVRDKLSKLK